MVQLPPQSQEAESSLLGAVLLSSACPAVGELAEKLKPRHFYRDRHRLIWAAMLRIHGQGDPVDVVTVTAALGPQLEEAGDKAYIYSLPNLVVASAANWRTYARIVLECAALRGKLNAARDVMDAVFAQDYEALADAERRLARIVVPVVVQPEEPTGRPHLRSIA